MKKRVNILRSAGLGLIVSLALTVGCSKEDSTSTQRAETVAASEMAEQMEAAKEGRAAAKAIVTKNWTDSMQLQKAILEARAKNSRYEMEGKKGCQAAFDTAFFNTIRTVRPELASQLQ